VLGGSTGGDDDAEVGALDTETPPDEAALSRRNAMNENEATMQALAKARRKRERHGHAPQGKRSAYVR